MEGTFIAAFTMAQLSTPWALHFASDHLFLPFIIVSSDEGPD
jgi:hypothetical protein